LRSFERLISPVGRLERQHEEFVLKPSFSNRDAFKPSGLIPKQFSELDGTFALGGEMHPLLFGDEF
jgi:hypothetical protein